MLDDFEDDLVGLTTMDEAPDRQSDWPSKQRTLSQKARRSKVFNIV